MWDRCAEMNEKFSCREIARGVVEGEALVSEDQILFYHADPATGIVTEHGHCLEGVSVRDKILVFPGGKGSSVVQQDGLYHLDCHKNMPSALIVQYPDPVLVAGAIIMELPMVDRVDPAFYELVKDGDMVLVNADEGYVEIQD